MGKYIKLFEKHSDYEAFVNSGQLIKPNVSYCQDVDDVHYNPHMHDYSKDYMTFEALQNNITLTWVSEDALGGYTGSFSGNPILYSLDNGNNWTEIQNGHIATVNTGQKILVKAINNDYGFVIHGNGATCRFISSGTFNVYGNLLSMFYGDNFIHNDTLPLGSVFVLGEDLLLISAENLIIPKGSVAGLFDGNSTLVKAPALPYTTLEEGCYCFMFRGCTSLTTAPELPATTLTEYCYYEMFQNCSSLTNAPTLPAKILAPNCYQDMFHGCSSLTTAPELPATTLAEDCYKFMFTNSGLQQEAIVPSIFTPQNRVTDCYYMYANTALTYDDTNGIFPLEAYLTQSPKGGGGDQK